MALRRAPWLWRDQTAGFLATAELPRWSVPARCVAKELSAMPIFSPDTSGGHLAYNAWRQRAWDPAAHRAGLGKVDTTAGGARYTGVTFHDLRRANATALIGAGVDVKTAQHRLGHSDVRLTLDVYAQAVDAADRSAAERIGLHFLGIDDDGNT